MQSGISVSSTLRSAFNDLVTEVSNSTSPAALIATIDASSESIAPLHTIRPDAGNTASIDAFFKQHIHPHLSTTQAAYLLVFRPASTSGQSSATWLAITYVSDTAPVRSKMLFASTRLTLVRELGKERFQESVSFSDIAEIEAWLKSNADGTTGSHKPAAPLTEEEETLRGVKEAEAQERGGMDGRRLETGGKLSINITDDARHALEQLRSSDSGHVVQLGIDMSSETLQLATPPTTISTPNALAGSISSSIPRYTLYQHDSQLIFVYTCPAESKLREKMLYASSKRGVLVSLEKDLGLDVTKKFELDSPAELTAELFAEEVGSGTTATGEGSLVGGSAAGGQRGFARPARPGRR